MILAYILILLIIIVLVIGYIKLKPLLKLTIEKEKDGSYSVIYNKKTIYNANPK